MNPLHYLNNQWVPENDLKISVFDLSVIRGFGVFDFLRTYNNQPFKIDEHIERLFRSAKILGISIPKTKTEIKKIVEVGLQRNKFPEKNVRIVVTGGVSPDSLSPGRSSLFIIFTKAKKYPKEYYEKGIKVITYPHLRAFPDAKSLNYLAGIVALQQAKRVGAIEAIFVGPGGKIYEGTTSNFFAVIRGKLVTPKKDILIGITRNIVIEIAGKLKIPVIERDLYLKDIRAFEEAFISASNKELMPVILVNESKIANAEVGTMTRRLISEYQKLVH